MDTLSLKDFAQLTGYGRTTVRNMVNELLLPHVVEGSERRIPAELVEPFRRRRAELQPGQGRRKSEPGRG